MSSQQQQQQPNLPRTCVRLKIAKCSTRRKEWKFYENRFKALTSCSNSTEQCEDLEEWTRLLSKIIPSEKYLFQSMKNDDEKEGLIGESRELGLKIGTFNVLFDLVPFFIKPIIRSRQRYAYTVQLLKQENFDILVLNEVTAEFLKILQQDEFFKTNYYFSDIFKVENDHSFGSLRTSDTLNESLGRKMGNLILSKYAPDYMYMELKIHESRPVIYAFFSHVPKMHSNMFNNRTTVTDHSSQLCIIGAHTTAMTEFAMKRRHELLAIISHPLLQRATKNDEGSTNSKLDVILMGDLNLHDEKEDVVISDMNFIDAWNETRTSKGYTFDSSLNDLVRWMFYGMEIRRMRLDRILMHESSLCAPSCKVKLFANRPLRELFFSNKRSLPHHQELLNEVTNNDEPRITNRAKWRVPLWWKIVRFCLNASSLMKVDSGYDYLFASDHFGLKMRVVRCDNEQERDELRRRVLARENNYCDFDETNGVDEKDHDGMEDGGPFSNHRFYVVVTSFILLDCCGFLARWLF
ncbi:hypothetical protein FDP41_005610 [Naegleria fowleri]|uniref:Endonuclease/exonuclease/phosphatase domain-containing protein n=1 Tax=Naegleria fowleri TaxID=5763 RepID=A0A6A5BL49_NAEFO|nr:uncharacterized protein FDP41_005610 [Naegleria fowleri]KAF0975616.1 hypothetical protein FDP41_005610 [Naegleria fowleri]